MVDTLTTKVSFTPDFKKVSVRSVRNLFTFYESSLSPKPGLTPAEEEEAPGDLGRLHPN